MIDPNVEIRDLYTGASGLPGGFRDFLAITAAPVDPVQPARNKLRMSFKSLAAIANSLGFNSKTEVKGDLWLQAALDGSTEALDYIVDHCVRDVLVLEKVAGVLKGLDAV